MYGLTMEYPLTLNAILRHAEALHGRKPIVTRRPDKSYHRYTYAAFVRRARSLSLALQRLGVRPGDRVATLSWNTHQHLEAYFGIPGCGAVLHTLNLRLHPDDLTYIINHADDKALLVDETLLPLYEKIRERVHPAHVVVIAPERTRRDGLLDYEELLAGADPGNDREPELDERQAAAMCYTSGTTGRPKGVVYSHRAIVLHTLVAAMSGGMAVQESDVVAAMVPMFHVNAWGLPFTCAMVGASQVFPGPHLDPASLAELFAQERVTYTAGVPTIWLGLLQLLDRDPAAYDLSQMRVLLVGGAAAPEAMIRGFQERHGLRVIHAWGMTELAPMGTICTLTAELEEASPGIQYAYRAKQGRPVPLMEVRARNEEGLVPWDGKTMGELEVRGAWVARAYYNCPEGAESFTDDGWFRTGDIVTIDERGYVELQDRAKDLVKSGGEWISSVALENALMAHPAVAEAAVIAVPHPHWQERPLAVVVLKEGATVSADGLRAYLAPRFAAWWLPDAIVFVPSIPRTAAGKFLKSALRARFAQVQAADQGSRDEASPAKG